MEKLAVIILAAGKGTRMGGETPKVLAKTLHGTLIDSVLNTAKKLNPEELLVVTGFKAEFVRESLKSCTKIKFANQTEQLGTGHAAKIALDELKGFQGKILILYGDVPLITLETLKSMISQHDLKKSTVSVITFIPANSNHRYGRIIKSEDKFVAIREHADCSPEELAVKECNSGIYLVDSSFLFPAVADLKNQNKQKEYYLTDIIERATEEGQNVETYLVEDYVEVLGVNTHAELNQINIEIRKRKVSELMAAGVIFENPTSCVIDPEVEIESGVVVGSNATIKGNTKIAKEVIIEGTCHIINSQIAEGSHIKLASRIENSVIGKNCSVGPCAHIRPETVMGNDVKIGNFVETKKATLANGVKASHLSYLGDCEIGEDTNIGAGTITCNYDGKNKFQTIIGKNVFVGSNSSLVAPIKINDNALIGAGSVITKDIKSNSLALTRATLIEKENYKKKS